MEDLEKTPASPPAAPPTTLADAASGESIRDHFFTDTFRARRDALQARLDAGEKIGEGARAEALGLPWLVYAVFRGCDLARVTGATVQIEGEPGEAAGSISYDPAGGYAVRGADGRLLGLVPGEVIH